MLIAAMDIETISPDHPVTWPEPPTFPPLPLHRPVCVCVLTADTAAPTCAFSLATWVSMEPFGSLEAEAFDAIGEALRRSDRLVTFNGRGFDLPVLRLAASRAKGAAPWRWCDSDRRRRFPDYKTRTLWHWDLLDLITDHGAGQRFSLDALARSYGLPGKGEVSGADVGTLFESGEIEQIARYCAEDTLQTLLCALRWMRHAEGASNLAPALMVWAGEQPVFSQLLERMAADAGK